jgi:pyruvate dehydrogenase E2 component (dihydrolipoamide acetyltransferase)
MGYDMQQGTVVRWIKKEGESVARGDVLAEIETDKATVEFEAFVSGVLRKIVAEEGVPIPVGELIAVITGPDEPLPEGILAGLGAPAQASPTSAEHYSEAGSSPAVAAPAGSASPAQTNGSAAPPPVTSTGEVRASPIARRLARERGIDLSRVTGTGPGGRIVEQDILVYGETTAEPSSVAAVAETTSATEERVDLSRMRQTIARVTSDSKREVPHFYVSTDLDMTKAMELRGDVNEAVSSESRVTVNDLVVKACAMALQRYPKFNAFFRGDHLQMNSNINIGIAIALDSGLIVPGINFCQSKSLVEIATANRDLIARAHTGTLRNEEYSGTTFSVSNLGMFDVDSFTAIIYPPHAAILAVGRVKEQPVVREGQVTVAQMMNATLSVDHRVADGAEAAQVLMEVKRLLENPVSLLL